MPCPLVKTLQITFTAPTTPPDNGYRVKWREVGASTYTTVVGTFVGSPISVQNIPACTDVEGTVEAVCGATYSAVATFTVPAAYSSTTCGSFISGSEAATAFYIYPDELINLTGSSDTVSINWNANDVPNRFTLYDSNQNIVATTGWVGNQTGAGPWGGNDLNTATNGSLTFTKSTCGCTGPWYFLRVETVGSATLTDAWDATISCTGGGGGSPTYSIVEDAISVNEGATATFTVTTTNVANGTTLYWTTSGTAVAGDFGDNTLSGSVTINNNTATISRPITADLATEGNEVFLLELRTGSTVGTVVDFSGSVTIVDTSTTPIGASGQVLITDEQIGTTPITCLGGNYTQTDYRTTVALKDSNGNPLVASSNQTVTVSYTATDCLNAQTTFTHDFIILAGQSSATYDYMYSTTVDCGQSNCVPETILIDCVSSLPSGVTVMVGSAVSACNI